MSKSKKYLDLNIEREVTDLFVDSFNAILSRVSHSPNNGGDAMEWALNYQKENFLSKYVNEHTDSAEERKRRAIVKWLGVETLNRKTNNRLMSTDPKFWDTVKRRTNDGRVSTSSIQVTGWKILLLASSIIRDILGEVPADLSKTAGFTSGATTSRKREVGVLASKFQGRLDSTPRALPYFTEATNETVWTLYVPELSIARYVEGNVLFTVPKTAVIDRVACKEPDVNVYLQKSIGMHIRKKLRSRAGIDLNDQSKNRNLARAGSKHGKLATIDLSSASDTVTETLVKILLPAPWFKILDDLRSPRTRIGEHFKSLEMFSSMGNGFTFELESLIFYSLAKACFKLSKGEEGFRRVREVISVYGDDIIIPVEMANRYLQVLRWTGFKPNVKKTFVNGPFRESCGGHYYRGIDVTPFFLRRPFKDVSDLILTLNQYRAWIIRLQADYLDSGWDTPNEFVRLWCHLANFVPKALRGGWDLESRTSLVTQEKPKCELQPIPRHYRKKEDAAQLGLYLSRLHELDKRDQYYDPFVIKAESTSPFRVPTQKWNVRPCVIEPRVFGWVKSSFGVESSIPFSGYERLNPSPSDILRMGEIMMTLPVWEEDLLKALGRIQGVRRKSGRDH